MFTGNIIIKVSTAIIKALGSIVQAGEQLGFIDPADPADKALFQALLDQLDELSIGLDKRQIRLQKQVDELTALFALGVLKDEGKAFLDLLGLVTKEKPIPSQNSIHFFYLSN